MPTKAVLYQDQIQVEACLFVGQKWNDPMYHKDIKIFRNVNNNIEFILKDSDRLPVKILGQSVRCIVVNPYNDELMLTRFLVNTDEQNGIYTLKLTPGDIEDWSAGFFQYCITLVNNDDGTESLFYTTLDQEVTGKIELLDAPFPKFAPSKLILPKDWTAINFNNINPPLSVTFVTSRFPGSAFKDIHTALQTFSIKTTNFSGTFYVQGSLEENPDTSNGGWFNIPIDPTTNTDNIQYNNYTGMDIYNFDGNYVWLRFQYIVFNPRPIGTIDRIWLKV